MKCILIFGLVALLTSSFGQDENHNSRIIGGYEVEPKFRYPFMVSTRWKGKPFCGGSRLNYNTVITAAHCSFRGVENEFEVHVHRHDLSVSAVSEGAHIYNVTKRIPHPRYNLIDSYNFDVAIWKTDAKPEILPYSLRLDSGDLGSKDKLVLSVIGWGTTSSFGNRSDKLLQLEIPIINREVCTELYSAINTTIHTDTQICAGHLKGGKDACQGDSGGPAFVVEGPGRFTLVGIVSWGEDCALPNLPGVYTRIGGGAIHDFIFENN